VENGVVQQVAAFYDDSGVFSPGQSNFVSIGMVVIPLRYIRENNDAWWEMLINHFPSIKISTSLEQLGIEVKSSDLQYMLKHISNKASINKPSQTIMIAYGMDTEDKLKKIIESIYDYISNPIVPMKYLAVCANKSEVWQKFYPEKINKWELDQNRKQLGNELSIFLLKRMYEYLLQRLQYLSKDTDFEFSDSFIIGDEISNSKTILNIQSDVQAGLGKFSDLPAVVNRSWFGSSLHDPCLQIADWVTFAVRTWAEKDINSPLRMFLPKFRGYPDFDNILGKGIVCCPDKKSFPDLLQNIEIEARESKWQAKLKMNF
jgi:hypothetical protein